MVCPRCGEDCHCDAVVRPAIPTSHLHPRFQPEPLAAVCLVDPEAFDVSEQQFSASLAEEADEPRLRFVPAAQEAASSDDAANLRSTSEAGARNERGTALSELSPDSCEVKSAPAAVADPPEDPDAWRREVAARLQQYRSRRKVKAPRYPSLRLKFDPPEQSWNAASSMDPPSSLLRNGASAMGSATFASRQSAALERIEPEADFEVEPALRIEEAAPLEDPEPPAKIIEFPRSYNAPVRLDELADPVVDRPRIVEAPEIVPPPPAMGGILLVSPAERKEPERRPGFEVPLQSAPLGRRVFAALVDLLIVLVGLAIFGFIAYHLMGPPPPFLRIIEVAVGVNAFLWSLYQYMLLVHNGSTPGLRAARLQLRRFDGRPVNRNVRRWRVITSVLSGLSLGMGYGWSFLDEDALCWHDRITHTYLEPKPKESKIG